jgi:hypothetical protein
MYSCRNPDHGEKDFTTNWEMKKFRISHEVPSTGSGQARRHEKTTKMFCDFCVWRVRHPSKIAKRCFLNTQNRKLNPAFLQGTRGVYFLRMYSCGKINATFAFPSRFSRPSVQILIWISSFPD